jgi:cell division protein FtsI (penicillin-binding protein 3)
MRRFGPRRIDGLFSPIPETHGFATSGWNAVPVAAKVIERIAPLLGLEPRFDLPPADRLLLASVKESR